MIVKIVMFALLLAAAGCENEAETSVVAAPPVMVVRVDEHLIVDRIQVTGDLLAKEEASVAAEVSGHVTGVLADEGDAVEAGDAVMEIDPEQCLLAQGLLCLGPATRSGCGAPCVGANMPCSGCMGPTSSVRDHGAKALSAIASGVDANDEAGIADLMDGIVDPIGTSAQPEDCRLAT